MKVLGIETSCDETAVAVVEDASRVLASQVASQIERHKVFGGVVPEVAAREHLKVIDYLTKAVLKESSLSLEDIDAIAVTQGPGLIGALLVGVSYAKGLAASSEKPLTPVNHVHAHIHGALLGTHPPEFPALALVVSGGHTNLYFMTSYIDFELIAHSVDDACGECFDKVAKLFGLGYPGGPAVEQIALKGSPYEVPMPKIMEDKSRLMFSYSGLKTNMVNLYNREKTPIKQSRLADIMASFQEEALGQLVRKIYAALLQKPKTKTILVAGGVAANQRFRKLLADKISVRQLFPNLAYCSDNAAMIAALGCRQFIEGGKKPTDLDWDCYSRYPY